MTSEGANNVLHIIRRHPRQVVYTFGMHMLSVATGVAISSTSVILHKLLDDQSLTQEQGSWFASIFLPGLMVGCFLNAASATRLGPKRTSTLVSLAFMMSLLIIALGQGFWTLCIGRFLLGASTTGVRTCIQPFICEYSHPGLRGLFGSLFFTLYCIGYAAFIPLGHLLNWRLALVLSMGLPAISLVFSLFMHESPTWLLGKGLDARAADALRFYERPESEIQNDVESIKKCLEKQLMAEEEGRKMSWRQHINEFTDDFMQPSFLKPMFFISVAFAALEWSSFPVLAYYLVIVFEETHSTMDPFLASTVAALMRIIWAILGNALVLRVPRRVLFLVSAPFMMLSLCGLATYCMLTSQPDSELALVLSSNFNFVPLLCIMGVHFFFATGYGITLVLVGEIFPVHLSNIGASTAILIQYAASFLAITLAPPMKTVMGLSGLFFFYSGVILFMFVFGAFLMPETKGLTLREIQERYYAPKRKPSSASTKDIEQVITTKL